MRLTLFQARFAHDQVDVLTNSRVKEVREDKILFTQKDETGNVVVKELPMGFCLWSTGVGKIVWLPNVSKELATDNCSSNRLLRKIGQEARRTTQPTRFGD